MSEVVCMDPSAIEGIGDVAKIIGGGGVGAIDRLRESIDPAPPQDSGQHFLELRLEQSGKRHYLQARPLKCGDLIEVWIQAAGWELARYEYAFGDGEAWAILSEDKAIAIQDDTPCRWP
ncbi:hypothetical protein GCM10023156_50200 [Novipirellula rosea]|uniref:Uncharacterized protein n=2 Tax=Novipirellula rosea TaxID=1031540 RepID=A0ABP8NAH1_9BACT